MGTIAQLFESGKRSADKGYFNNLVMLARIDGKIDTTEVNLLSRIATRLGLTSEQVKEIIEHPDQYPIVPPVSREERYERFIQFVKMVNVDGQVDPAEERLASKYGTALGLSDESIASKYPIILEKVQAGISRQEILEQIL
jgi:tellurite resistance protein